MVQVCGVKALERERIRCMPTLQFPTGEVVGTLDWVGAWSSEHGPVLATGLVDVPDGKAISLHVQAITGSEPLGDGGWTTHAGDEPVDLSFVRALPADAIESLHLDSTVHAASVVHLRHLALGLRKLYLAWSGLDDEALQQVAQLTNLTYLQTWGNRFTDGAVQALVALQALEFLYLEEESLSPAALAFVDRLPRLRQLGLQDLPITDEELAALRRRLPTVDVGR